MRKYIYNNFTCSLCQKKTKGEGYPVTPIKAYGKTCRTCYFTNVQRARINNSFSTMGLLDELNQLL